jgi:hypothetical protein
VSPVVHSHLIGDFQLIQPVDGSLDTGEQAFRIDRLIAAGSSGRAFLRLTHLKSSLVCTELRQHGTQQLAGMLLTVWTTTLAEDGCPIGRLTPHRPAASKGEGRWLVPGRAGLGLSQ